MFSILQQSHFPFCQYCKRFIVFHQLDHNAKSQDIWQMMKYLVWCFSLTKFGRCINLNTSLAEFTRWKNTVENINKSYVKCNEYCRVYQYNGNNFVCLIYLVTEMVLCEATEETLLFVFITQPTLSYSKLPR